MLVSNQKITAKKETFFEMYQIRKRVNLSIEEKLWIIQKVTK